MSIRSALVIRQSLILTSFDYRYIENCHLNESASTLS